MQQRRDDPQIAGDRRLAGEQRQHPLVDLEVAAVDPVVVGDDHPGQLDVLVADRLERAVELLDHEVEAAERLRLELLERLRGIGGESPASTASYPNLPGDVALGALVLGVGEDLVRRPVLDQLAVEHERGRVRDPRGLLHVVRDDHDRVALLELVDQLLDLQRRDRVERRARLVHQDHLGLDRDRARDAQALLLAARQSDARARSAGS